MPCPDSALRPAPKIAVVVPCFNEEQALPLTARRLAEVLDAMERQELAAPGSYILCVDDGSSDSTWGVISGLHAENPDLVKGISLAHNRGHQYALFAGLMEAMSRCDAAISIDADLQDDPAVMARMGRLYREGCDVVYGVRASRDTDTAFKRITARTFYRLQHSMGLSTIYDHADYRLMSRRALEMLSEYGESNLFLRGIVPMIGLKTAIVTYDRSARVAGESKYPLSRMLSFSVDGVTSFSAKPLTWIFITGLILLGLDIIMALWVLGAYFAGHTIAGWTSLMLSVWFLGSLILMAIGVVGVYIGKIFTEVKHRPRYAIAERLI